MTETLALEGLGAKIRFNASGFESDLIALTLSPKARATIDTTHLGTEAAKTKRPGQTQDLGTVEAVFDHDPAAVSLVGRPAEQVIITYPEDLGQEFDPIVLWGFAVQQGGEKMFPDERMVTSVVIKLAVPDGPIAPEEALVAVSLVDPALWLGFWGFEDGQLTSVDLIAGAPAGPVIGGTTSSIYAKTGKYGKGNAGGVTISCSAIVGPPTVGSFTIGGFRKAAAPGASRPRITLGVSIEIDDGGASWGHVFHGVAVPGVTTGLTPPDSAWRHYAASYNSTTGEWKIYRDAVLWDSGTITAGLSSSAATFGFLFNGGTLSAVDNIFATKEVLTLAAIAALSGGSVPETDGNLYA